MRVLQVSERDGGYAARLQDAAIPVPAAGEVLIRVLASGVNRADLSQIAGRYPSPPGEPEGMGLEVAGVVEGSGEQVAVLLAGGGHAEYVAAPAGQMFPLPKGLDAIAGAAIPEAFLTAFVNLVVEGGLAEGQAVLIHAGASGVGLAAIQTAKFLGARVAATTRTADKVKAMQLAGADLALHTPGLDFAGPIAAAWGPSAVHVILDPVGAATFAGDLAVLAPGGRIISLATMAGSRVEVDLGALMKKRAHLIGSTLRARSREEKAKLVARFRRDVLPGFESGKLKVSVDSVFPAARAAEAFQRMRANQNTGKIVIDWAGL
jgi:putative PIG3 family NAD(P)H quinone oxidoreductase